MIHVPTSVNHVHHHHTSKILVKSKGQHEGNEDGLELHENPIEGWMEEHVEITDGPGLGGHGFGGGGHGFGGEGRGFGGGVHGFGGHSHGFVGGDQGFSGGNHGLGGDSHGFVGGGQGFSGGSHGLGGDSHEFGGGSHGFVGGGHGFSGGSHKFGGGSHKFGGDSHKFGGDSHGFGGGSHKFGEGGQQMVIVGHDDMHLPELGSSHASPGISSHSWKGGKGSESVFVTTKHPVGLMKHLNLYGPSLSSFGRTPLSLRGFGHSNFKGRNLGNSLKYEMPVTTKYEYSSPIMASLGNNAGGKLRTSYSYIAQEQPSGYGKQMPMRYEVKEEPGDEMKAEAGASVVSDSYGGSGYSGWQGLTPEYDYNAQASSDYEVRGLKGTGYRGVILREVKSRRHRT